MRSRVRVNAQARICGSPGGVIPLGDPATLTEGNCVAARRGGEQPEVNDQSVTQVNSIRPSRRGELAANWRSPNDAWPLERATTAMWYGKPDVETPRDRQDDGWCLETE
jgi:hypothetical protein